MSKYARIENSTAVEVFIVPDGQTIADCFHKEVAALFTACPADVTPGSTVDNKGEWTIAPVPVEPVTTLEAPKVSPVEFKLLFTPQERVAMKGARKTDPVMDDFFDVVDDPRLTFVDLGLQSTKDAIAYLEFKTFITSERAAEILTGTLK